MATKTVPKEDVKEYVERRIAKEIKPAVRDAVQRHVEEQLEDKIDSLVQEVLSELDDQGSEAARSNIDITRMVTREVVRAHCDESYEVRSNDTIRVNVPVAGRRGDVSEVEFDNSSSSEKTVTKEVPIEGGDDPEMIEIEVSEPTGVSAIERRMNSGFPWVFEGGITVEERVNAMQDTEIDDEEVDPSDVPVAGWQPTEDDDE